MTIPISTLNSLVKDIYLPQIVDNVFNSMALLNLLLKKPKFQRGGNQIRVPIEWDDDTDSGGQGWFSKYDKLDLTPRDPITTALYDWANAYGTFSIAAMDEDMNQGAYAVTDMLEAMARNAEKRLKKQFTTSLFAAADANPAKAIMSLNDIIAVDRNLGGIDSTQETWWDSQILANSAADTTELVTPSDEAYLLKDMARVYNLCSDGSDKPNHIVCSYEVLEIYEHIVGEKARWVGNSKLLDAGFQVFNYKGTELVPDKACSPTGTMYFLNTKYLYFKVSPTYNFSFQPFQEPIDQLVKVGKIIWRGNMVCSHARRLGNLNTIPTW